MSDRPFRKYTELIQILKNRGMIIKDEKFAIEVLKNRSYYGLINGFKTTSVTRDEHGNETFTPSTIFEDFVSEYFIENELKSLLLKYSLLAEIRFKEAVAHRIGEKYGENLSEWLDTTHYRARDNKSESILRELQEIANTTNDNPTAYYRNQHDTIPPWILIPNITIGQFKNLYTILTPNDKEYVCSEMLYSKKVTEVQKKYIKQALSILWEFRNNLAHGSRLLSFESATKINLTTSQSTLGRNFIKLDEYRNKKMGSNDLLCFLGVLCILLGNMDINPFRSELVTLFDSFKENKQLKDIFSNYYLEIKLPNDLKNRLNAVRI